MLNFNFVTERLLTGGGLYSGDDVKQLLLAGVTHVIDCCLEENDVLLLAGSQCSYLWNPTLDDGLSKSADWFARSIHFALPTLIQPKAWVYAHCAQGINRGPSTAYAILRAMGWSPAEAEQQIRKNRPQVGLRYMPDAEKALQEMGWVGF